jgi:hypothetical protein
MFKNKSTSIWLMVQVKIEQIQNLGSKGQQGWKSGRGLLEKCVAVQAWGCMGGGGGGGG